MSLNLSTLTSSATSGDVLAEALTTADFLEPVPVLRNLARGSQKGGDAKQDVALNQPKALPLIDGDGYYYGSGVANNHAYVPSLGYGPSDDHSYYARCYISSSTPGNFYIVSTRTNNSGGLSGFIDVINNIFYVLVGDTTVHSVSGYIFPRDKELDYLITYNGSTNKVSVYIDGVTVIDNVTISTSTWDSTTPLFIGARGNSTTNYTQSTLNALGYIKQAKAFSSVVTPPTVATATPSLNIDFTATNSPRHGATKFACATGQVVTINQSGNDPATIIKKPVLRFDGTNDGFKGLFNQTITDGYMFAAFSVLGDGGEFSGRVFAINSTDQLDSDASGSGAILSIQQGTDTKLRTYVSGGYQTNHPALFDDANGDILHESLIKDGTQLSRVNNADQSTTSVATSISAEEFSVASRSNLDYNTAIDLEFLALFDATITDAQADDVRNYINNRNNVFSLIDSQGYYFFDGAATSANQLFTGSSSWPGRIVGSDNDDPFKYLSNPTYNDRPTTDGYKINFADNSDHFLFNTPLTGGQAGWQVVGTSLGTFAYRVDSDAVTEINLLGNLGSAAFRQAGDLYGIILLPESATGADIESARRLLIDRGASEGFTGSNLHSAWYQRGDIVEFKAVPMPAVTNIGYSFASQTALASFPAMSFPALTYALNAWQGNTSMSDFGAIQAPLCTNFKSAWRNTTALQSFPAGAKLGTEASNVNFTNAWRDSGLTSFSTPLPTATNTSNAWLNCSSLTSFSIELPQATNVSQSWYGCSSLKSFSTELPSVYSATYAWYDCSSLTDFSADVFSNWNPSSISSGVFNQTWVNCPLTAQSVENILTSIDSSGKYGTSTGASGGTALGDAGIDIDYNVATGSLSAATNSAVDSLKAKGWVIVVNGVTL